MSKIQIAYPDGRPTTIQELLSSVSNVDTLTQDENPDQTSQCSALPCYVWYHPYGNVPPIATPFATPFATPVATCFATPVATPVATTAWPILSNKPDKARKQWTKHGVRYSQIHEKQH